MLENAKADFRRFIASRTNSPAEIARMLLDCPGLQAVLVYRMGKYLQLVSQSSTINRVIVAIFWPLYRCMAWLIRKSHGIDLDLSATIGPGLCIGHRGGITVRHSTLGAHCSINQQVKLLPETHENTGPIIGDRVWIGAHARIIGHHTIGTGATIGAGAVVTEDVGGATLVLGNPARVAQKYFDNSSLLD